MTTSSFDASQAAERLDLYSSIHKALRAWMAETLVAVGRCDGGDADILRRTLSDVEALLSACESHLRHEQSFIHPLLERARCGSAQEADEAHATHERDIARLRGRVGQVRQADVVTRFTLLTVLYRELSLFVAENFAHMHWEETVHNETLWASYSDAQLQRTHEALVQCIEPGEMAETLRHMLPALSPVARLGMLSDMRAKMPPSAFEGVLALAETVLSLHEASALFAGLGIQPSLPRHVIGGH